MLKLMVKEKQINKLKLFLESKSKTLLINQVNEETLIIVNQIYKLYLTAGK